MARAGITFKTSPGTDVRVSFARAKRVIENKGVILIFDDNRTKKQIVLSIEVPVLL